jgi:hypothetical protein
MMLQINMDTNSHILHQVKTTFYGPCHLLCYLICIVVNYLSLSCLGKFYLVDFGYPNRLCYLAPYSGVKYHLLEFKQGPRPGGRNEVFNFHRSSLCNVIECSFGVLKMKSTILLGLPSFLMPKQTQIILSYIALHNFFCESAIADEHFDRCDRDKNYSLRSKL